MRFGGGGRPVAPRQRGAQPVKRGAQPAPPGGGPLGCRARTVGWSARCRQRPRFSCTCLSPASSGANRRPGDGLSRQFNGAQARRVSLPGSGTARRTGGRSHPPRRALVAAAASGTAHRTGGRSHRAVNAAALLARRTGAVWFDGVASVWPPPAGDRRRDEGPQRRSVRYAQRRRTSPAARGSWSRPAVEPPALACRRPRAAVTLAAVPSRRAAGA